MTLPSLTELRIRQLEAERDELTRALAQAREITAALEQLNAAGRALHIPRRLEGYTFDHCDECFQPYPCETIRTLTGDVQ